jgi:hypothetical protein
MSISLAIAFFTGQSRPGCCELSPEQHCFLDQLAGLGGGVVRRNFPYRTSSVFREVPLAMASWRNFRGYLVSRRPDFARAYRDDVTALIARAERVVFLAGSSGLELFNNLGLAEEDERKCLLICYGPVARRMPRYAKTVIAQSARDYLSRVFFRRAPGALECGHMGYLSDPEFLRICREQIAQHTSLPCTSISR